MPENPSPALVSAISDALGRPTLEALEALGFEVPRNRTARIDPELVDALEPLPMAGQKALARMLPALIEIAEQVTHPVLLARAAEGSEPYGGKGQQQPVKSQQQERCFDG